MIKTEELKFQYNKEVQFSFPNIQVNSGQTLLILGNSGAGKTTLLHILAGLLKPHEGTVIVEGQNLYNLSAGNLDAFRGTNISVIFQKPHFVKSVSALENLVLAQKFSNNNIDKAFANTLLSQLDIGHRSNAYTYEMSQGEQQRLSIARAIINKPKLILADEPTSALDDKNCEIVLGLLQKQAVDAGAALIIVTHDQRLKDIIDNTIVI